MPEDMDIYARGSELGSYQAPGTSPIMVTKDRTELVAAAGIALGLALTILIIWGSRALIGKIAPEVGEDENDIVTKGFSAELGIVGGVLAGLPVKYHWRPRLESGLRRTGHPASLDAEFTVGNPRGVRLHIHKEGVLNRPLASLPDLMRPPPPLLESYGYVLRLEPAGALSPEELEKLDKAAQTLCAAELYEAALEGGRFSFMVTRRTTYEMDESRAVMEAGAAIASLFA